MNQKQKNRWRGTPIGQSPCQHTNIRQLGTCGTADTTARIEQGVTNRLTIGKF